MAAYVRWVQERPKRGRRVATANNCRYCLLTSLALGKMNASSGTFLEGIWGLSLSDCMEQYARQQSEDRHVVGKPDRRELIGDGVSEPHPAQHRCCSYDGRCDHVP